MAHQTNVEELQVRFELQLKLLRQLFNTSNLPFGTPEDLASFAEWLVASGTFADDIRAVLTALSCTEQPTLTRMELLDLLCFAVGGISADSSGTALRPAVWQILVFINGFLLSGRQAPLRETRPPPARNTDEAPQINGIDQDAYVLERFDLPSVLPWVVSGKNTLENDLRDIRQATLPDTMQTPARSAEGEPQIDGLEPDAYVLERFDLPSDLTWVVSGRDALNDLEVTPEKVLLARANLAVDVCTEPVHTALAVNAWGTVSGPGDHSTSFETVLLDEKPALLAIKTRGTTSKASQVATDRPRRGAPLVWLVSLASAAVAGFLLGTITPRHARPCIAASPPHEAKPGEHIGYIGRHSWSFSIFRAKL